MTQSGTAHFPDRTVSTQMLEGSLEGQLLRLRPRRVLLICAGREQQLSLPELSGMFVVALFQSDDALAGSTRCAPGALPFEDGTFDLVVMHGMVRDGSEVLLDEACKVLLPGGQLVLSGPGRYGGQWLRGAGVSALKAVRLCRVLGRRQFRITQCQGMGVRGRPMTLASRWQRPLLPWSEMVMIRARHRRHETRVSPLQFARPGAAGARSPALDSFSRRTMP